MALIVNTTMIEFIQNMLQFGPQAGTEALNEGGSLAALGAAAAVVAAAIWRRGPRN